MLAPNATSAGEAPRKSATAERGGGDNRVRLFAGRIPPVGVGVVVVEVIRHRLHDDARHLGSAGAIEIGDVVSPVLPVEGEKLGSNLGGGEGHGNLGLVLELV